MMLRSTAAVAAFALAGAAAAADAPDLGDGFLCCNMRSDGSWISDSNYEESGKQVVPFGTPARFLGFGRNRVNLDLGGKRQSIGNDYSRDVPMEDFARRYLVKADPRPKVAAAPPKIRAAIESMKVAKGMTREQVLIAVGYPIASENPKLDAPQWKYWLWSFSPYTVHFDAKGHVASVEGDAETLAKVYAK